MIQILEDKTGVQRAEIIITTKEGNLVEGSIINHSFTNEQVAIFEEFCEVINDQIFSVLDEIEDRIESFGFKIRYEKRKIFDLQIYNLKTISFCFKI